MISPFLDTFYIVRILDYQAPVYEGVRGAEGQENGEWGGRMEKGGGRRKGEGEKGREKGEDEGREKGGEGEGERGEGEKGKMGERDPVYLLIFDHPYGASRLQFEVQKTKTNCDHFSSVLFLVLSYKIRHPKSIFF